MPTKMVEILNINIITIITSHHHLLNIYLFGIMSVK